MKKLTILCSVAAAILSTHADVLKQQFVPPNTRWLLHLDADAFRKTRLGEMVVNEKVNPKIREAEDATKLDFSFRAQKIASITLCGPKVGEEKDGVLILETTADIRGDLEKLIAFKQVNGGSEPAIARLSVNGNDLYTIGADLNAMEAGKGIWIVGKSKTSIQSAREVVLGKSDALQDASFLTYPAVTNSFFFLAVADTGGAGDKLPAQAKILQKAEGGRVIIGESGEKLFLNLALRSRDADTLAQIQQVVQGLIAFVSLAQADNKDLSALVSSASVSSSKDIVSVNLSFPLDRAMKKVREEQ